MIIADKYKSERIENPKYSLEIWFNNLIEKDEEELSLQDICIMLRQSIFESTALPQSLKHLNKNPLSGDLYAGELLQVLFEFHKDYITNNKEVFNNIINKGLLILDIPDSYITGNYNGLSASEVNNIKQLLVDIENYMKE